MSHSKESANANERLIHRQQPHLSALHAPDARGLAQAADSGVRAAFDQMTGEGAGLQWHWNNPPSRQKIRADDGTGWCSRTAAAAPWRNWNLFGRMHACWMRRSDGRAPKRYFYMTWANKSRLEPKRFWRMPTAGSPLSWAPFWHRWDWPGKRPRRWMWS